jgi:AAA domain
VVLKPVDALGIYQTDFPPPEFVIEDILPRRGLTLAAGRPKVGKSWLTLQLAVAECLLDSEFLAWLQIKGAGDPIRCITACPDFSDGIS